MAQNIATLAVKFVADTSGIKSGVASVVQSLATGAAVTYGFYKAVAAFTSSSSRVDDMSKIADRLGTSFETIQKASLAGGLAGVPLEAITDAIDKMSKTIGSGGMSLDKRFLQVADSIAAIKDPAEQARKAMEVFGKSGAKLLPLLKQGRNAFREAGDFIKRFNLGITDIESKNVERMNDSWTKLGYVISGTVDKIVAEMAPSMGAFLDMILEKGGSIERIWKGFGMVTEDILTDFADFGNLIDSIYFNIERTMHALEALRQWGNQTPFEIMEWDKPGEANARMNAAREKERIAGENSNKAWADFWSGKAGKELSAEAAKRRAGEATKVGRFGGTETGFAPGSADKFSQQAARIISGAGMSQSEKDAAATAKNTAATKEAVEKVLKVFSGNVPVLALGNI